MSIKFLEIKKNPALEIILIPINRIRYIQMGMEEDDRFFILIETDNHIWEERFSKNEENKANFRFETIKAAINLAG